MLIARSVNFINILYGFSAGWTSSSLLVLESDETSPLVGGALNREQRSWVTSLFAISGVFGTILFYLVADITGRRMPLWSLAIPHAVRWIDLYPLKITHGICVLIWMLVISFRSVGFWLNLARIHGISIYRAYFLDLAVAVVLRWFQFLLLKYPNPGKQIKDYFWIGFFLQNQFFVNKRYCRWMHFPISHSYHTFIIHYIIVIRLIFAVHHVLKSFNRLIIIKLLLNKQQ